MHVYERRRLRLLDLLKEIPAADLARRSEISPTTLSRYKKEPGTNGAKNMSEENARRIESAGKKPEGWLDKQHLPGGVNVRPVAQELSDAIEMIDPPTMPWESILKTGLPKRFMLIVKDDAMATNDGTGLLPGQKAIFETGREPTRGGLVLVRDKTGHVCIRRYIERRPGHWIAAAGHPGFSSLDSLEDELHVLAVHAGTLLW